MYGGRAHERPGVQLGSGVAAGSATQEGCCVPLSSCRGESGLGSEQVLEKKEGFSVPSGLVTLALPAQFTLRTGLSSTWGASTGVDNELARDPPISQELPLSLSEGPNPEVQLPPRVLPASGPVLLSVL